MRLLTVAKGVKVLTTLAIFGALLYVLQNVDKSSNRKPHHFNSATAAARGPKLSKDSSNDVTDRELQQLEETKRQERISTLKAGCRKHGLDTPGNDTLHKPNPWEYFVAKKQKLVWCNVFKSGSSSWMYVFNKLAGYSDGRLKRQKRIPPMTLARQKYHRPSVEELLVVLGQEGSIGFIVARHPFERLVSGYRDKIAGALPGSLHYKLNKQILSKYRQITVDDYRKPPAVQTYNGGGSRRRRVPNLKRQQQVKIGKPQVVPTFKEFVSYVLDEVKDGHELDMHWTPAYSFCNPCQVNLTHIVKFESFDVDSNAIVKAAGIQNYLVSHKGKVTHENASKKGGRKSVSEYLKELDPTQLENLIKLYQPDFDIFGYKPDEFPHS